jgi:CMP-N,N'-diacetyllegionaminic acid synthase
MDICAILPFMAKKHAKIIGIIPARGGNSGVPNKNLRRFAGKPLIAWTILSALDCHELDKVIVITKDEAIAKTARRYGAQVIWQPDGLAQPTMGLEPSLKYAYEYLEKHEGYRADGIALLLATNPLRRSYHIKDCINLFL